MTLHKALNPRNNIDILYVSRKEGKSIDHSIYTSIQGLEDYIKKKEEWLISDQLQNWKYEDKKNNNN